MWKYNETFDNYQEETAAILEKQFEKKTWTN